ncbi:MULTISPECIES: fatty acid desaturase [Acinetobacter]|uniref:Fatty acid desaturase n=1 Tax=Acinetobacter faecalis TaxID=2665161 RepID=A0AB35UVI1_9GAMM|nr:MULTISPECIES: fatty acid desaturase [Acinetobacter]MDY6456055.1 fatty acid desaturase [Acinetobacter faecalis]MDY6458461.1 fatty acid desaturase [Acinetobacter faecalis]MDY6486542.1 fatty acid desaturase [Acinetobacter faecalis]MDY6488707.1 fatty acid desaturase [Acinetobacter faecalis]MDY6529826.1 fatty acid desaturase [Acinetobacter faecalis]
MSFSSEMTDQQKISKVRSVVTQAGDDLRQRFPILKHQNFIGASILFVALAGMILCALGYAYDILPVWACIPLIAIFASLTHELEHDLIHYMYFKKKPWAHHLMLALVWLARPNTISPWARRTLHLNHHKYSGSEYDLEERGISNGMPWGIKRILVISDQLMTVYLRPFQMYKMIKLFIEKQPENERKSALISQLTGFFPLSFIYYGLWYIFVIYHVANGIAPLLGQSITWSTGLVKAMPVINFLAIVWVIPNFIRSFSLQFISSNMHYYGDIDPRDVIKQTQVLNPWWLMPFQLFCCNFGSTHAIHHFVVKEPFYVRQMTSKTAHKVMREVGVRFNDIGTFKRVNRWN